MYDNSDLFCFLFHSAINTTINPKQIVYSCGEAHSETSDEVFKIAVRANAGVFLTALAEREGDMAKKF